MFCGNWVFYCQPPSASLSYSRQKDPYTELTENKHTGNTNEDFKKLFLKHTWILHRVKFQKQGQEGTNYTPLGDHLATTWRPLGDHLATTWWPLGSQVAVWKTQNPHRKIYPFYPVKRQIFLDAPGQTLQNQLLAQISHFLRLTARNPPSPTLAWIQDLQFGLKLWISWGQTTWKKILPEHLKKCSIFAAEGLSVPTTSKQPVRKNSAKWQLFMALSICCRLLWPVKELYSEDICQCFFFLVILVPDQKTVI